MKEFQTSASACVGITGLVLLFALACGCGKSREPQLRERVHSYCYDLGSDLERAAAKYREIGPLDQLSEDQRKRAEETLLLDAVAVSYDVRSRQLLDIQNRLMFCASIRVSHDKKLDEITIQMQGLRDRLVPINGSPPSAEDAAKTLEAIATLARSVDAMPIID